MELLFELPNTAAESRLLDIERCRSLPKTPLLGGSNHAAQRTQIQDHGPTVVLIAERSCYVTMPV